MFSFGRDARYRLEGHRHNPYVGSFHTVDRRTKSSSSSMLLDSSLKNPFIGTVRHSPAGPSAGLKGLLWEEEPWKAPVTSQVKLSREKKYSNRHASTSLLASIPITLFRHTDAGQPVCGICLDTFADGDELRPLPCSHCFHRACVDEWLLGLKSDERTFTNNCPCCRQDISPGVSMPNIGLTSFTFTVEEDEDDMSCGSSSSPTVGCAIPRESFQRLGQYLSASDIGTSKTLSERFNDEDSNLASDADSEESSDVVNEQSGTINRVESEQEGFNNGRDSYCDQNLLDLSADSRLSEVPRNIADLTYEDSFNMTEDHFNKTGRRSNLDAYIDQGEAGDDEDCNLGISSVSNVSICTATNNIESNGHDSRRRNIEEDNEGSVVSDMEEEYFMGYSQAGVNVPFDALGGSLYSNCGVPLKAKAVSPSKGPV